VSRIRDFHIKGLRGGCPRQPPRRALAQGALILLASGSADELPVRSPALLSLGARTHC